MANPLALIISLANGKSPMSNELKGGWRCNLSGVECFAGLCCVTFPATNEILGQRY
jgi:hypothetical protein